jgi:hypothetical protein
MTIGEVTAAAITASDSSIFSACTWPGPGQTPSNLARHVRIRAALRDEVAGLMITTRPLAITVGIALCAAANTMISAGAHRLN